LIGETHVIEMPEYSMHAPAQRLQRFRDSHAPRCLGHAGASWQYLAAGAGDDCILLLHGGGGSGEMFFDYFFALEGRHRVLAPTIPSSIATVAAAIDGIAAILDAEGVPACHAFGHSQGGFLAIALSERMPERIRTLALSSTFLPSERHARRVQWQLRLLPLIPDRLFGWVMKRAFKRAVRLAGSSLSPQDWQVLALLMPHADAGELRRAALFTAKLHLDYHQRAIAARWRGPALLFETGRDRIVTAADVTALRARYPDAEIHRFKDAGHLDIVTDPRRFVSTIQSFLASAPRHDGRAWLCC
jgi:pyruvate dehydrogenase E2 component (dihydrolipoamide acetyltransferase)